MTIHLVLKKKNLGEKISPIQRIYYTWFMIEQKSDDKKLEKKTWLSPKIKSGSPKIKVIQKKYE